MNSFAQIGVPVADPRSESSPIHGLAAALESLTECTDAQIEKLKHANENSLKVYRPNLALDLLSILTACIQIINRARVICIGAFRDDTFVRSLESFVQDTLVQINKQNFSANQMPVHQCDLVLVNIFPNAQTSKIKGNDG